MSKLIESKTIDQLPEGVRSFGMKIGEVIKYDTLQDCKDAYINAEQYWDAQKEGVVSVIRGTALKEAKIKIVGIKYWTEGARAIPQHLWDEWLDFLNDLDLLKPDGTEKSQVKHLMRFVNSNERAILKSITIRIPNAEQFRLLSAEMSRGKKINDDDLALMYQHLAKEMNDGKQFESAEKVKTAYIEYHKQPRKKPIKAPKKKPVEKDEVEKVPDVYVRTIFEEEVGTCPDGGASRGQLGSKILDNLPEMNSGEWKKFYHKASMLFHADQGGTDSEMAILASINNMMNVVFDNSKKVNEVDAWQNDYSQWKEDRGYESDFIPENELVEEDK